MRNNFPLFGSPIELAHHYWAMLLKPGDHAIDATCGNGKDTLALAKLLCAESSQIIGIDVQAEAIARTRALLTSHLSEEQMQRVFLYQQSHASFPALAYILPIRLIVYNFGYLPSADKSITTQKESTLESIQKALSLLMPGGVISATCYPGHEEGAREQSALLKLVETLDPIHWSTTFHTWTNRRLAPALLLIQKKMV